MADPTSVVEVRGALATSPSRLASSHLRNHLDTTVSARIRRATVGDAAALRSLGEAVVPSTYSRFGQVYVDLMLDQWWSVDRMAASLAAIPHWVVEDPDGRVVGVANLGEHGGAPTLWKLYVHPDHHGAGLGSALLREVIAAAGDRPLELEVVEGNEQALGFYRRHGFVEFRRTPEEAYPAVTLIWMRRDLG